MKFIDIELRIPEPTDENLHREREQAYMQGYEDASKRFRQEPCEDAINREAVIDAIDKYDFKHPKYMERFVNELREAIKADLIDDVKQLPPVNPQESIITWVTGADGAKIAFWDVPVWKVTKICEILGEPQK